MLALATTLLLAAVTLALLGGGTIEGRIRHKGRVPFLFQVMELARARVLVVSYRPNRVYYKVGVCRA